MNVYDTDMQFFDKSPFPKHSVLFATRQCAETDASKCQKHRKQTQTDRRAKRVTSGRIYSDQMNATITDVRKQTFSSRMTSTKILKKSEKLLQKLRENQKPIIIGHTLKQSFANSFQHIVSHFYCFISQFFFLESSAFRSSLFVFSSFFCIFVPLSIAIRFQRFGVPYAPVLYQIHKHFFLPPFHNYLTF